MNNHKNQLLVIDDDTRLRELLGKYLNENGAIVTLADTAETARKLLKEQLFDLVVLDVMLPGESGFSLVQSLRNSANLNTHTPILFLTAMADLDHRLKGLELGGDDYLTKPFEPKELLLRIRNIIRRSHRNNKQQTNTKQSTINFGKFIFIPETRQLYHGKTLISLTDTEKHLLEIFLQYAGQVLSREDILTNCQDLKNIRSVDVQITRLRHKLADKAGQAKHLQTVRNQGYIFYL